MPVRLVLVAVFVATAAFAADKKSEKSEKPEKKAPVKITPEGPCDKKQLDALKAALVKAERATWTALVSKGLADACQGKLPAPITLALDDFHVTPVDEHLTGVIQGLRDAPDFAKAGCAKWEDTANAHVAPGDRMHSLYKDCDFAKAALVTETELVDLADLGAALVMMPLHKWLTTNGMEAGNAKRWVRALLGLDATMHAEPKKPPEPKEKKEKPAPKKK